MWVRRGNKAVFYLSRRVGGRVRSVYVGTGPGAEALAAEVEARKRARRAAAQACAARAARARAAEGPLDDLCADLDRLVAAVLLDQGFHRHDRGKWRKKRERRDDPPE